MKSGKIFFLLITLLLISLYATIVGIFKQKPLLTFVGTLLSGFFAILEIIISIKNNLNIEVELRRQRILNQALIQGIKKGRYENPFFKEAETTMLKGSYRITVSKLEEALKIEPDNVKAHIHLGALYLMKSIIEGQKKLLDKAKNEFMIAGKLSNESELQVIAKQGLGIALSESGENYPEAVRILKEALSLKPDMPLLRSNLGLVYLKMGKMEHAKQYFEEDIKKYPYLPYPYYYLGNYFEEKQQLFAAIAEYEKVLFIDSDHLLSFWRLILCNMKVGRVSEALFLCILFLKNTSKHIKLWKNAKMLFFILSLEWIKLAIRKKVSKICRLVKIPFAGPSIPLIQYAR